MDKAPPVDRSGRLPWFTGHRSRCSSPNIIRFMSHLWTGCRKLKTATIQHTWRGRAMAQAVNHWPLTAEAWVHAWVSPCGICGGQSGTGTGFSPNSSVFLSISFIMATYSIPSGGRTTGQLVAAVQRQSHPTDMNNNIYESQICWHCCLQMTWFFIFFFGRITTKTSILSCATNSLAPEPEGSSPYSQEPTESTPHHPSSISLRSILIPSIPRSSERSLSFGLPQQNLIHFSLLSSARHMPCPPHSRWLDLPNDIWGCVKIMKLLNVQHTSFSYHFISLRSQYSPQIPVLEHP
jgi:hypothetical protein